MTAPNPPAPRTLGEEAARTSAAGGTVRVKRDGAEAEIAVREAGPVGVVVDQLRVEPSEPAPLPVRARHLAESLRPGGERLQQVECDERLGGATLRTIPEDMRDKRFYEVELDRAGATVRRHSVGADGTRAAEPFAVTRDELSRTIDRLAEPPPETLPAPHPLEELLETR